MIHHISNTFVSKSIHLSDDNYHNLITNHIPTATTTADATATTSDSSITIDNNTKNPIGKRPIRVYNNFGLRIRQVPYNNNNNDDVDVDAVVDKHRHKHRYQFDLYNFVSFFNTDGDNHDADSVRVDGVNKKQHSIGFYLMHYISAKLFLQQLYQRIHTTFDTITHIEL